MAGIVELGNDPEVLRKDYPKAYEALPECYKNDHSLNFFFDIHGTLCAEHTLHYEEYVFESSNGEWLRVQ